MRVGHGHKTFFWRGHGHHHVFFQKTDGHPVDKKGFWFGGKGHTQAKAGLHGPGGKQILFTDLFFLDKDFTKTAMVPLLISENRRHIVWIDIELIYENFPERFHVALLVPTAATEL